VTQPAIPPRGVCNSARLAPQVRDGSNRSIGHGLAVLRTTLAVAALMYSVQSAFAKDGPDTIPVGSVTSPQQSSLVADRWYEISPLDSGAGVRVSVVPERDAWYTDEHSQNGASASATPARDRWYLDE
jgi:hypothetical protein